MSDDNNDNNDNSEADPRLRTIDGEGKPPPRFNRHVEWRARRGLALVHVEGDTRNPYVRELIDEGREHLRHAGAVAEREVEWKSQALAALQTVLPTVVQALQRKFGSTPTIEHAVVQEAAAYRLLDRLGDKGWSITITPPAPDPDDDDPQLELTAEHLQHGVVTLYGEYLGEVVGRLGEELLPYIQDTDG